MAAGTKCWNPPTGAARRHSHHRKVKRHKPVCSSPHYRVIPVSDNHVGDHEVLVWKWASQIVDALDSLSPELRWRNRRPQQNEQHEPNRKGGNPTTFFFLNS